MKRGFVFLCGVILLVGCGKIPTGTVSGTIQWEGKPIEYGRVEFAPLTDKTHSVATAEIRDGQYSAIVPCGEVVVRLYKLEKYKSRILYGKEMPDSGAFQNVLPAEYNEMSTLQITIQKGKQTYDFP